MLADPIRQSKAVDGAGHFDVTENNIHDRFSMQENGHCLVGVHRFDDFISAVPEVLRDRHSHQYVVFYNENRFLNVGFAGHPHQRRAALVCLNPKEP
jgi:hypothetical protein